MKRFNIVSCLLVISVTLFSCKAQVKHTETPDFEFRAIYSPTNASDSIRKAYHTHHVDYDWGLWGHNLHKVLGEDADNDVYATIDGKKDKDQYCFSSDKMYNVLVEYIIDNFGYGDEPGSSTRISIMPRDNKKSCTCNKCVKLGNTSDNATPAVTNMMKRLAKRFSGHQFFTSAYHTTKKAPAEKLPSNVGVIISAVDLPMRVNFTDNKGYHTFMSMINDWKDKTTLIYIWDYPRNYSDYLSPFPCLLVMQKRFQLYKEQGVKGIFLNGSGDDYSSFDDMQTYVLAKLLYNVNTNVEEEVKVFYKDNYPQTGRMISDYYLSLENKVATTNHIIPLYGSMEEEVESYLDPQKFTAFRSGLDKASKNVEHTERTKLNYLLTALSFTQIQLLNLEGQDADEALKEDMVEVLKGHNELHGMKNYGETDADIDNFIKKNQQ